MMERCFLRAGQRREHFGVNRMEKCHKGIATGRDVDGARKKGYQGENVLGYIKTEH